MKNYQRRKAFIINDELKEFKSYTKDGFYYKSTENLWFWKGRKNGKPFEFHAKSISELSEIVNRKYQTLSYYGISKEHLTKFIKEEKPKGIDRIVPIGKTTDFSLTWDGYNLIDTLSRRIEII